MTRGQVLVTRAVLAVGASTGYALLLPSEPVWLFHALVTAVVATCGVLALPLAAERGGRGLLRLGRPAQAALVAALLASALATSVLVEEPPAGGGPWTAAVGIAVFVYGRLWWSTSRRGEAARRDRMGP